MKPLCWASLAALVLTAARADEPAPLPQQTAVGRGHTEVAYAVAFQPGGKYAASAGFDRTVRLWDAATGRAVRSFTGHTSLALGVSFAPDGKTIASCGADNQVRIWEVPQETPLREWPLTAAGTAACLSNDGGRLFAFVNGSGTAIDSASGKVVATFADAGTVRAAVAVPGSQLVATLGADRMLHVWNAADGKPVAAFLVPDAAAGGLAVSPNGAALYTVGAAGKLRAWPLPVVPTRTLPVAGARIALSADGNTVAVASDDSSIQVCRFSDGVVQRKLDAVAYDLACVALTNGGAAVVAGTVSGDLLVWNGTTGKLLSRSYVHHGAVTDVQMLPGGQQFVTLSADGMTKTWALPTDKPLAVKWPAPVSAACASPDGKRVATLAADATVRVWRLDNGQQEKQLPGAPTLPTALAWGGTVIAATGKEGVVCWDSASGKVLNKLDGPAASLAVGPAGDVCVVSADHTVTMWKVPAAPAKPTKTWAEKLAKPVRLIAFTPDGATVAIMLNGTPVLRKLTASGRDAPAGHWPWLLAPSGTRYAGIAKREVATFDAATQNLVQSFKQTSDPLAVAWVDDKRLAVLDSAGFSTVEVTGLSVFATAAYFGTPTPDGKLVAAGSDRALHVWDLAAKKSAKQIATLPIPAAAVAVSRDGKTVAAAFANFVDLWSLADGAEVGRITGPTAAVGVAFPAEPNRLIVRYSDDIARVYDLTTRQELYALPTPRGGRTLVAHPSLPQVVMAGSGKSPVAVSGLTTVKTTPVGPQPLTTLALSFDGNQLFAGGLEPFVRSVNPTNGQEDRVYSTTAAVAAIAVSRNNQLVAVADAAGVLRLYNPNEGQAVAEVKLDQPARVLAFNPGTTTLATADDAGQIRLWNTAYQPGQPPPPEFGTLTQTIPHGAAVAALAFAPDGKTLYSVGADKRLCAWKVPGDTPILNLGHPNIVDAVAYQPGGKLIATACHDGQLRLWDAAKGTLVKAVPATLQRPQPEPLYCVAWDATGKQLATGGADGAVKLWDDTGKIIREIKPFDAKANEHGHREGVYAVAVSPDGQQLASAGNDRTVKLWSMADGKHLRTLVNPAFNAAHPGPIHALRFAAKGDTLATVGAAPKARGYLAIWSCADGKLLAGQEIANGVLYGLDLLPDGRAALAVGSRSRSQAAGAILFLKQLH